MIKSVYTRTLGRNKLFPIFFDFIYSPNGGQPMSTSQLIKIKLI